MNTENYGISQVECFSCGVKIIICGFVPEDMQLLCDDCNNGDKHYD